MGGILGFLTKIQSDIITSKQSTRIHISLADFTSTMRNFDKLYANKEVIVGGSGTYNVWLLTNPDKTAWVLIGVVTWKSGNISTLDSDKNTYGKKVIAYQKLTTWQIDSILAFTGSVYNINFFDEWLFNDLTVTDFSIISYNSGSLLEYTFNVETPFYESLQGKQRDNIAPTVTVFPFTLDL